MGIVHRARNYGWSEQYNVQIKDDLRTKLVQLSLPIIPAKPRILTLPSIMGSCAYLFRATWPEATIIGLERNKMIGMASELFWDGTPSTKDAPLDRLFISDVRTFMDGKFIYEPIDASYDRPRKNVRRPTPAVNAADAHLHFDLAFLDYTGQLTMLCGEAFRFMKQNMTAKSVCGMTFSYPEDMTTSDAVDYLRRMKGGFRELLIQPYRNGTDKGEDKGAYMIFAVFTK